MLLNKPQTGSLKLAEQGTAETTAPKVWSKFLNSTVRNLPAKKEFRPSHPDQTSTYKIYSIKINKKDYSRIAIYC